MSAIGTKRTYRVALHMSAFGGKADIDGSHTLTSSSRLVLVGTMLCPEPLGEVMRRRDFLKAVAGSAAAWPLAARAQEGERVRRIGMLTGLSGEDTETKARIAAFLQELQKFGWTEGRNLRVDIRAGEGNAAPHENMRRSWLRFVLTYSSPPALHLWRCSLK